MTNRWGEIVAVSNDKGPYKLIRVQSDGSEMTAIVLEGYGIQGSPVKGGQVFLLPSDGDEGRMVAICMPPPAKRVDQQKPGEVTLKNHDADQRIQLDKDGNINTDAKGKRVENIGSDQVETIGGDRKETTGGKVEWKTGGVIFVNC